MASAYRLENKTGEKTMTKLELIDLAKNLECAGNDEVAFARWSEAEGKTIDYVPSGCTPTGVDGVTRIGLSRHADPLLAAALASGHLEIVGG